VFRQLYDKRATYRLACALGIDYPRTHVPADADGLAELDLRFPVVVKPAFKPELNRFTAAKAWPANDRRELRARYEEATSLCCGEYLMVQEFVPGTGHEQYSFAALCGDGEPLVSMVARRTRQFPIEFGRASTFVESVEAPDVEQTARRLLAHLRYTGLVEVEFKRDPRDGILRLLDVNPRVWGWHTLGRRAGVDFVWAAWALANGCDVTRVRAEPGLRWVRLATDVPAATREIARGRLSIVDYARSIASRHDSGVFAIDDPIPGCAELPLLAFMLLRRKRRAGFV
jgi:D-aspartate ligase